MTRSRRRKLSRQRAKGLRTIVRTGVPLASALVAAMPAARAQQAPSTDTLQTVVVTAEKVQENLQSVPISVEAFDNRRLTQLGIVNLDDYVALSPAVSYMRSQGEGDNGGPGSAIIYIRGVVSAVTATTPARSRASASTWTSSRSRPSRALCLCTSTT